MLFGNVVERHLLGSHEISLSDLVRLDAGLARDSVEHEFEREADSRARHAAIRQDRAFVGGDGERATAIGGKIIWSRQDACHLRSFQAGRERVGRIGAGIDRGFAVDAAQTAVALGIGGDTVVVLSAIGAGDEMFAAVLDPAHRMAAMHSEPTETNLLGQQDAFVAEPAADVGSDDADLPLFEAETFGQSRAHDVGHLAGRIHRQLFQPRVPERNDAAPFDWRHALASGADLAEDLDRGIECLADVDIDKSLEKYVVAPMLVDHYGAAFARFQHVVHSRQFLQIEGHRRCQIFGLRARCADAHRRELAHVAQLVDGERRLLRDFKAAQPRDRADRLHANQIGGRERAAALSGWNGNAANAGMRYGAADEGDVLHSGQSNIGDELPATAQEAIIFLSADSSSDALGQGAYFSHLRNLPNNRASALFIRATIRAASNEPAGSARVNWSAAGGKPANCRSRLRANISLIRAAKSLTIALRPNCAKGPSRRARSVKSTRVAAPPCSALSRYSSSALAREAPRRSLPAARITPRRMASSRTTRASPLNVAAIGPSLTTSCPCSRSPRKPLSVAPGKHDTTRSMSPRRFQTSACGRAMTKDWQMSMFGFLPARPKSAA